MAKDYYKTLGVGRDASEADLKKAYKRLAIKYHPDKSKDTQAEDRFKEASEAYGVLSDSKKRTEYDQFGKVGSGVVAGAQSVDDILRSSIFRDIFGGVQGRRRQQMGRGASLRVSISIELKDILKEQVRTIRLVRGESCSVCKGSKVKPGAKAKTCPTCKGLGAIFTNAQFIRMQMPCGTCNSEGQIIEDPCLKCLGKGQVSKEVNVDVKIPAGIESGTRVRLSGQGAPGENGGPSGDLFVDVLVAPHPTIHRQGNDLMAEHTISFPQAALGAKISVETLGETLELKVPRGTQPGGILRLRGQGAPNMRTSKRGDFLVQINISVPKNLTKNQEELIQELLELENK